MTAIAPPRRRSASMHGESPAAAASLARQTSPATMHTPVLTTLATCAPTPDSPAAGPAATSTAATTARRPTYSSEP